MTMHPTVDLVHPSGRTIPIDVELAPIIATLWAWDIKTRSCCQGPYRGDWACIMFTSHKQAEKFKKLVPASTEWKWEYDWVDIPRDALPALRERLARAEP
jgi:hypothetical protein